MSIVSGPEGWTLDASGPGPSEANSGWTLRLPVLKAVARMSLGAALLSYRGEELREELDRDHGLRIL